MNYTVAAHQTTYNGVTFRSRLEARWAAFFDLAGWKWQYEPLDLVGWTPDFLVEFPCSHSECSGRHSLLVEVKPYFSVDAFEGHPCMEHPYGEGIPADSGAAFGINPDITQWEMAHGAGGGIDSVHTWVHNADELWKQAGFITQYRPAKKNGARANVPQKKGEKIRCEQDHSTGAEQATSTGQLSQEHAQAGAQEEEDNNMAVKFLKPSEGNGWFKFSKPGDRIAAKFISRRVGVKTPKQESANILVVDVLESTVIDDHNQEVDGPTGRRSINESGHSPKFSMKRSFNPTKAFFSALRPRTRRRDLKNSVSNE